MDCLPHFHVAAIHDRIGYKSGTPGLGVLCTKADSDTIAGAGILRNSLAKTSVYGMAGWRPWSLGPVKLGVFGGLITGYTHSVDVMGGGIITLPLSNWAEVHMLAVPHIPGATPNTLSFSFTVRY